MTLTNRLLALLILITVALSFTACSDDDESPVYDVPTWNEIKTTENTGTPEEQIKRFIDVNKITNAVTSPEGLVYIIEEPGNDNKPTVADQVTIFYQGYKVNGDVFDQTGTTPRTFALNRLIKAWQIGIPKIGVGGRIWMLVPPSLGYGSRGSAGAGISGNDVIVFEVKLVNVP